MIYFVGKRFLAEIKEYTHANSAKMLCECVVLETSEYGEYLKLKTFGDTRWFRESDITYVHGLRRLSHEH